MIRYALFFILVLSFAGVGCTARRVYDDPPSPSSMNTININIASVNDLERLPGIGRKTAEAIIAHREQHGPFRRPEHLLIIRGVSEKRFLEIRPLIRTQ